MGLAERISFLGQPEYDLVDMERHCQYHTCRAPRQTKIELPIPLCSRHVVKMATIFREIDQSVYMKLLRSNPASTRHYVEGIKRPSGPQHDPLVYYMKFGDRIKIGFSRNIDRRLSVIPHDELLAVESGGADVENARHKQFAKDRITGEWFRPSDELLAHIAQLRQQAKLAA